MKKILKSVWNLLIVIGEANYAANLARNGKIKESQSCYADSKGIGRGL